MTASAAMTRSLADLGYRLVGPVPSARLTVVIPFHAGADRPDIFDRIGTVLLDAAIPRDEVHFLVADDASSPEAQARTIAECERLGVSYLSTGHAGPFSRARARNAAAMVSASPYLMIFDVDLMPYDGFFRDALREIDVQQLDANSRRFVMFPAIYLTESGSREFLATDPADRRQRFLHAALIGGGGVERASAGTSVIIVDREHYLACGGMSEDFAGWGFEDHELICRLMFLARDFPEPSEPLLSYGNFSTITEYRGWRALYRLYGELTFRKGLVVFHRWHASPTATKRQNEGMFHRKLEAWYHRGEQPAPLPSLAGGRTLLVGGGDVDRAIRPRLGHLVVRSELDPRAFEAVLSSEAITRVVFRGAANTELADLARAAGVEVVIGALPSLAGVREGAPWQLTNFTTTGIFAPYVHSRRGWGARLTGPARRALARLRPKLARS